MTSSTAPSPTPAIDPQEFRKALGCFATGVTVITTRGADGTPVGVTANSFNSVSLDPPLVLWSLAKSSRSLSAYQTSAHWAVHILDAGQEAMSNRFASRGEDKFSGVPSEDGLGNVPLLPGCAARLQCRTRFMYEGGDHIIFVGEVLDFTRSDQPPLLYAAGKYALVAQKAPALVPDAAVDTPDFDEDFLAYLFGRAQQDFVHRLHAEGAKQQAVQQVSDLERYVLFSLVARRERSLAELAALLAPLGWVIDAAALQPLLERALVTCDAATGRFQLSEAGQQLALGLVSAAKAVEAQLVDQMGPGNALALKHLLKLAIAKMDSGVPHPWSAV